MLIRRQILFRTASGYLGSHSGKTEDKVTVSGLTPAALDTGVTFKEAELTFLCHKIYLHQFSKKALAPKNKGYYASMPKIYPNLTSDGTDAS